MQLLITLKGPEDLSALLPKDINSENLIWNRLWNFSESVINTKSSRQDQKADLLCLYNQLSFDLQCLFKTFEVTVGQGIDIQSLATYWKQHEAILLVEIVENN